jgi:hypothetical protein
MSDLVSAVIAAFAILSVKHAVADFFLQTPYQYLNKGVYGHPGGLLHAGIHAALTTPAFLVLAPASVLTGSVILAGEFIAHYHIDWLKEGFVKGRILTPETAGYWHALGLDQLAHMLTYVTIIAVLAR